jgi:phosphatidylglycerophosphate synthase
MKKTFIEIKQKLGYIRTNPLQKFVDFINIFLAAMLRDLFIRLGISANKTDIVSIIVTVLLSMLLLSIEITLLRILIFSYFILIDFWDIIDGAIARKKIPHHY